jgi:hypothetical protein
MRVAALPSAAAVTLTAKGDGSPNVEQSDIAIEDKRKRSLTPNDNEAGR